MPVTQGVAQFGGRLHRQGLFRTLQPELGLVCGTESGQALAILVDQGSRMPQQQCTGRAMEEFHVADAFRLAEVLQKSRQGTGNRLQRRHQDQALIEGDDLLAGRGTEADIQTPRPGIPAHGDPSAAPIAEFGPDQGGGPFFRLDPGETLQLLLQGTLLQGQLLAVFQVLQGAAAAATRYSAGLAATQVATAEQALAARVDHLASRAQHPCLKFLPRQPAADEPGHPRLVGDTSAVMGQALDGQALLLAYRYRGTARTTAGLEAQPALISGHGHAQRGS